MYFILKVIHNKTTIRPQQVWTFNQLQCTKHLSAQNIVSEVLMQVTKFSFYWNCTTTHCSITGSPSSVCDGSLILHNERFIVFVWEIHFSFIYANKRYKRKNKLHLPQHWVFKCVFYAIWVQIVSILEFLLSTCFMSGNDNQPRHKSSQATKLSKMDTIFPNCIKDTTKTQCWGKWSFFLHFNSFILAYTVKSRLYALGFLAGKQTILW